MTAANNDHPSLAAAVSDVQRALPAVGKDHTATVRTKDGGQFTYTYANLSDVHDTLLPVLAAAGLAWTVTVDVTDAGRVLAVGRLVHVDTGEAVVSRWPIPDPAGDPQRAGSALTYARRYMLCAIIGLVPDDDDDGQHARGAPAGRPAVPPTPVHTVAELRELIDDARQAGVTGDYEATLDWVADDVAARVDTAYSRIAAALAAGPTGPDDPGT